MTSMPHPASGAPRDLVAVDVIFEALARLQLPHCVASSGTHAKMERTLGQTGLLPRFQGRIFSATEVAAGRPGICSSTRPGAWELNLPTAPWWKTVSSESRRPGRPACTSSPMAGE